MRDLPPEAVDVRHQARKKLHGVLLPAIAHQVVIHWPDRRPERFVIERWKRLWAAGYGIPGSTEDLSDDAYIAFVWWVEEQAATRMGVDFTERKE